MEILIEIQSLLSGGITYKRINGKDYAYYQWREDGKQRSRRAKDDELEQLQQQIAKRKELQELIKGVEPEAGEHKISEYQFRCVVRMGVALDNYVKPVAKWEKRECFTMLKEYIYGDIYDRVYILYGLRRTGKTTLIRQIISGMNAEMRSKAVFIQVQEGKTLDDMNRDLKYLEENGYRYVFIDEVTLLNDFIEGAALFSDVFAASGMKIVLSGTDSLGFMFTEDEELYDRCIMSHTTFIPYREFERVLGVDGIDNYIRYGGTMSPGGKQYNDNAMIFATKKSTDEYVDSAIARNIQHSLKNYQYEGHFRSLRELYERNELTSAINQIVEDINHRFTLEVFDRIDIKEVTQALKELLEIKNKAEQVVEIENRWMSDYNRKETRTVFSQPGIRYSQAEARVLSLMQDEKFCELSLEERNRITERIIDEIKGRMMEDIILLETQLAQKHCEVFRLQFAVGEFDMVVFNPKEGNCKIYEIKHSMEVVPEQCKHLRDAKKCEDTEFRYGPIVGKYVIYRGVSTENDGVTYLNVEEYLKNV